MGERELAAVDAVKAVASACQEAANTIVEPSVTANIVVAVNERERVLCDRARGPLGHRQSSDHRPTSAGEGLGRTASFRGRVDRRRAGNAATSKPTLVNVNGASALIG